MLLRSPSDVEGVGALSSVFKAAASALSIKGRCVETVVAAAVIVTKPLSGKDRLGSLHGI